MKIDFLRMNRFWLETYGCQMNKAESNALEETLLDAGWIAAEKPADADLVILNTCSVRLTAENRIWGRIGYFKNLKESRPHTLAVMGCMAERLGGELKKAAPAVDMVVGTFQKTEFSRMLARAASDKHARITDAAPDGSSGVFSDGYSRKNDYKALVPVMHGCDNFCSYCIVPYVRGREVSREPESVYAEIEKLLERGVKEITFLGQNVNSYRFGSLDFPGFLESVFRRFPALADGQNHWVRFLTSHPKDFSDALITVIAAHPAMCRQIHLPVQHGSNTILRRMNRQYKREEYLRLVERLRGGLADARLSTDILVGFPGETEEDFRQTLDLMREVRFDDAFTYYYNPREGTAAWNMEDTVPEKLKLERLALVIEEQRAITAEQKKSRIGSVVRVLAEEVSKKNSEEILGRTYGDEMTVFPAPASRVGSFCTVRLRGLRGNTFYADEVKE